MAFYPSFSAPAVFPSWQGKKMEKLTGKKRREGPLRRKESRGGDIEEEGGQSIVFFLVVVTLRHEEKKEKISKKSPKTCSWYISAFRGYPLFFTVSSHESEEERLAWRRKKSEGKLG